MITRALIAIMMVVVVVAAEHRMSMVCASDVKADIGLRALGDDTCRMCHSDGCCPLAMDTCGTGSDRWWHCKSGGATTAGVAFCKETSSRGLISRIVVCG